MKMPVLPKRTTKLNFNQISSDFLPQKIKKNLKIHTEAQESLDR